MSKWLKGAALSSLAAMLSATLAINGCASPTAPVADDDERPPIIVSGGSVRLRAVVKNIGKRTSQDPGKWEKDAGKNVWFHDHRVPPGKHFIVHVFSGGGGNGCESSATEFDVKELTIQYGASNSFRVFIDPLNPNVEFGRLATDAPAERDPGVLFWLEVPGTDKPTKVVLGGTTCTLDPSKSEVHIYQRRR